MQRLTAAVVMLLVGQLVAACSWLEVRPVSVPAVPRADTAEARTSGPTCTRSLFLPVTDTVLASMYVALGTGTTISLTAGSDCYDVQGFNDEDEGEVCPDTNWVPVIAPILAVAVLGAALHAASATYGYRKTAECREAGDALMGDEVVAPEPQTDSHDQL